MVSYNPNVFISNISNLLGVVMPEKPKEFKKPFELPEIPKPDVEIDPWSEIASTLRSEQLRNVMSDEQRTKLDELLQQLKREEINDDEFAIKFNGIFKDTKMSDEFREAVLLKILYRISELRKEKYANFVRDLPSAEYKLLSDWAKKYRRTRSTNLLLDLDNILKEILIRSGVRSISQPVIEHLKDVVLSLAEDNQI